LYTSEHKFIVNKDLKEGKQEVINKLRKGPKTPIVPEPSSFLIQAIFGLMLGDLTAEKTNFNSNTRLRFYYSVVNKAYVDYLYSLFKAYVKTEPRQYNRKNNKLIDSNHTVM
jgi:hypothetical protein